ncbi:ferric reductase-like transmembrane domain-containing protein [Zoogloea sp.]|uniref:ferredoxin reductase family protein n=1 Tax=Zoogloea sp. TaxID=49181 RepID=UPI001ACC0196|nr:ferric reductase-like transmembrane domain-containing protein [Zoogloea sp.]MBN8284387.1 ferric reductase-like transmembrane domain-containing protein [Zoogloea sp.]
MKRPLVLLAGLPFLVWAVFALPDVLASARNAWDWRRALILLSGTLALWWMSAGMLLAARPAWLAQRFGGLDRLYRLHKDIGIGAGLIVFTHWMLEWLPKNLAKAGFIERPVRGPRPPRGPADQWVDLAKDVGEWAGYILLALVVIALVKRIPYRYFRWVHKLFPLVFIAGAYHGLMLMPASFWQQPLGWLTAGMAALGVVPAWLSLLGRIGTRRQYVAHIESLTRHPDGVLEVVCRPTAWPGHRAGQHVLAHFGDTAEGAHPFTMASAWNPADGRLTLAIKALGDYTRSLPGRLDIGHPVRLEGPYGSFTFDSPALTGQHQVWVAGGIGITPFLARLQDLAARGGTPGPVDFFYSTADNPASGYAAELPALCSAAGVRLHRRHTDRDGPLPAEQVRACLGTGSSVWFCGPAAWGDSLARALGAGAGPAPVAFHRELFEFR